MRSATRSPCCLEVHAARRPGAHAEDGLQQLGAPRAHQQPTRGIDVGAKYEIYELIIKMAKQGKTIIVVSSELFRASTALACSSSFRSRACLSAFSWAV